MEWSGCVLMSGTISAVAYRHWGIPSTFWDSLACLKNKISTWDLTTFEGDAVYLAMTSGGQTWWPNGDPHTLTNTCFPICISCIMYYSNGITTSDVTINCYIATWYQTRQCPIFHNCFNHILTQLLSFHVTKISSFLTHQCHIYLS